MNRCNYHDVLFLEENAFRSDGTDQCWLCDDDVVNFGSTDNPEYVCLFHLNDKFFQRGEEAIDPPDWLSDDKKWDAHAQTRLKALLQEWNKENKIRKQGNEKAQPFFLPGLECGNIDFEKFTFSGGS